MIIRQISVSIFILITAATTVVGQEHTIPTIPITHFDYYPEIGFLTEGPLSWLEQPDSSGAEGYVYRVVILYQEIYHVVLFETISIRGIEGSDREIESRRMLNPHKLAEAFDFDYKGEFKEFHFIKWVSATSFEFELYKMRFLTTDINKSEIKVSKIE